MESTGAVTGGGAGVVPGDGGDVPPPSPPQDRPMSDANASRAMPPFGMRLTPYEPLRGPRNTRGHDPISLTSPPRVDGRAGRNSNGLRGRPVTQVLLWVVTTYWWSAVPTAADSDRWDVRYPAGQHQNRMWRHRFVKVEKDLLHRDPT